MDSLKSRIERYHYEIRSYLNLGFLNWDEILSGLGREEQSSQVCINEQIWTFLVACGYAITGYQGVAKLSDLLTRQTNNLAENSKIWLEVLPTAPRKKEGQSHIDLAIGNIVLRKGTESGIELDVSEKSWVCFCEMKWHSDISYQVKHDINRNQLARIIETALCFQKAGKYAQEVNVCLVTPELFISPLCKSRLYQYKFNEYQSNSSTLRYDLEQCILEINKQSAWTYPENMAQHIRSLNLIWCSFDELFRNLPESVIAAQIKAFWIKHGEYQGRKLFP